MLRKLRDHTSSKNAVVTPIMTRPKKSHSSTAPSSVATKLKPDAATVSRYRVMKPHSRMSTATQMTIGSTRAGLSRMR